jgi:pSer/pThr/pTyr-binding forkhead associated (FHA) protein
MLITVRLNTGEKLDFNIRSNKCIIGRSSKCDVVIPHEGLSRQHCLIQIEDSEIFVTDLDSTNGVFVDGARIPASVKTEFKSFLPISFGPVESLLVEFDESGREHTRKFNLPPKEVLQENQKTVSMTVKKAQEKNAKVPPKIANNKLAPEKRKQIILTIMVAIALASFAYIFKTLRKPAPEKASPTTQLDEVMTEEPTEESVQE